MLRGRRGWALLRQVLRPKIHLAYVRGERQIEPGLRLWSAGVILGLRERQKKEQPRSVCVGVPGEGRGSSLDLGVFLSLGGFVMVKVPEASWACFFQQKFTVQTEHH